MADDKLSLAVVTPGMKGTHQIFRREFPLLPDLVGRVANGDTERARTLADHTRLLLDLVQVHHDAEETYVWSILPERAPESAELVGMMLHQHADVHTASDEIRGALDAWEPAPTAAAGRAVADAVSRFTTTLVEHANLEEDEPLPIIADHLTPAEWGAFVQYASTAMPEETRGTVMGMLMEDMPAPAREGFLGNLPEPFANFLRTTGADAYAEYTATIRKG